MKDVRRYHELPEYKKLSDIRAVHRMMLRGKLKKCIDCGSTKNLENDHLKYIEGKKGLKYVQIRCRRCHMKRHEGIKNG